MKSYKLYWVSSGGWLDRIAEELRRIGHEVGEIPDPDFILGMTHSKVGEIKRVHQKYPKAFLINYNWDMYEWRREQDKEYEKLLYHSTEAWCPSQSVVYRMSQWLGLTNGNILKTYIPYFKAEISDKRYVLNPLRELPDRNYGFVEKVCKELNIPCVTPNHQLSQKEWEKTVAECSFLVSAYHEASTGGLSLIEGLYLGKPSLVSNSLHHGGRDYLGEWGFYFKDDDILDLKQKIKMLWNWKPVCDLEKAREFVRSNYSLETMVLTICQRLDKIKKEHSYVMEV